MVAGFRTFLLLLTLTLLFIWIGQLIAGQTGMMIAFILALAMNFFSYWYSDKIVLSIYRAKPLSPQSAPQVYKAVEELCQQANLPVPRIYYINTEMPNAFATGRNPRNSAICVTRGLLNIMDYEELKGVLGHELAHIKNRDTLIQTIAATIAGAIMVLANMARWAMIFGGYSDDRERGANPLAFLIVAIVAPIAALLIQMAISRQREFHADASGAKFAKNPLGLANALIKLEEYSKHRKYAVHPATAHLFIVNPLKGGGIASLFSTHPPIPVRVERLRKMAV